MIHPCDKPCDNKTASGYCATTVCINPQYANIGTAQYGQGVQKRIITHGDELRAMTDEELADWFSIYCCRNKTYDAHCVTFKNCEACWLDWLKEPPKEGET